MDFPAYVPAAVRAHITTLIEGDSWEPMGWQKSLDSAERKLAEIDGQIESCIRWGKDDYLPGLRKERAEAAAHREMLAGDVDCLRRLGHDARMGDAFALLTREFAEDRQWRKFIHAAWAARLDFAKYRDRLKRVTELKGEIAEAAETLENLIRQFSGTGIIGPSEFYSIPELLRQTDNHEMQGHNLHMWRSMRRHVLGDLPRDDVPEVKPAEEGVEPVRPIEIVIVPMDGKAKIDPAEEARNTVRYAWGTAPDLPALLDTVAKAAREFRPSESGMIGAAIAKREKNIKTEYLRAFGNLLTDAHGFALTTPIMQAIAIVANVVINLPDDVDVTYNDVRQALTKLGGERQEKLGRNITGN